jgi:hypothetical protein
VTSKIGLLTTDAAALAGRDLDTPVLAAALRGEGWAVQAPVWHDPAVDWAAFDLLIIRTPWDYSWRPAEFMAWLDRASAETRILNGPDLIRWNIDKRYLDEFADLGVPVIPTEFCAAAGDLEAAIARVGDRRLVVKPSVSAGSREPSRAEIAVGESVLAAVGRVAARRGFGEDAATPLYARVDIASSPVSSPGASPQVIEVELFEPAFATPIVPEAVAAFTTAVKERQRG